MKPDHLKLEKISKNFAGPADGAVVPVLTDVDLAVTRGESLAIVGPSGAGKSTLLHLIGALDRPSAGTVWFEGKSLASLNDTELAALRNQAFGFVFQAHYLLPQCTVMENVLVPTLAAGRTDRTKAPVTESSTERAERLLKRVGLGHRLDHRPSQLSGGERQRAAVVRALINRPQLLLADEPTGSLDPASAEELGKLLVDLNREEGVTLIVVTHAMNLAARMARVLEIRQGRLAPASSASPLKTFAPSSPKA